MASSGKRARVEAEREEELEEEEEVGAVGYDDPPPLPTAESLAALRPRLLGLSREQLADLLLSVTADGSLPHPTLLARLPAPALQPVMDGLRQANAAIRKSLPHSRYGTGRDAFCYRRCATHVVALKRRILEEGKTLDAAGHWPTLLRYCVLAAAEADESVVWDEPRHNAWKGAVDKGLDRLALKAAKALIKDAAVGRAALAAVRDEYGEMFPAIQKPLDTAIAKRRN